VLSEDNDIDEIFADGLLKLAHLEEISKSDDLVSKLKALSDKFDVKFVFSVCCDAKALPEFMKEFAV
ncbi:MAG: twitching motility protein PilT, partial [Vallitaleaceae bacterium]|nr:twitching motility protein PilT [Vallitaleaceae bacterium]